MESFQLWKLPKFCNRIHYTSKKKHCWPWNKPVWTRVKPDQIVPEWWKRYGNKRNSSCDLKNTTSSVRHGGGRATAWALEVGHQCLLTMWLLIEGAGLILRSADFILSVRIQPKRAKPTGRHFQWVFTWNVLQKVTQYQQGKEMQNCSVAKSVTWPNLRSNISFKHIQLGLEFCLSHT